MGTKLGSGNHLVQRWQSWQATGVTFSCLQGVSSSSARLFDIVYDTEATMQRALRHDYVALLQQDSEHEMPYYGDVNSYLQHCAASGFPSVQVALNAVGCTEQAAEATGIGTLPVGFSRPAATMVSAMKDEYLAHHPYYKPD